MGDQYVSIGTILKPHGLSGEIKIKLKYPWKNARKHPGHFFMKEAGKYIPFFAEKIQPTLPHQSIVKFDDINTREAALKLGKRKLFLPEVQVSDYFAASKKAYFKLIGYRATDQSFGPLGEIEEVIEMPDQYIAIVAHESGKEIMIPLVDEIIHAVNEQKKEVKFNLPPGLVNLYLD